MATIAALTEDFEGAAGGAAVTTGNSIFDDLAGAATPTFNTTSPLQGTRSMEVITTANTALCRADFGPTATAWFGFYLWVTTRPAASTAIVNWYNTTTKIGDLRLTAAGELQLRDNNTARWTSTALATGEWHRVAIKVVPGSTTGHRVRIYTGPALNSATPSQDSLDQTATGTAQTAISLFRVGILSSDTATIKFDRLRGDDAVEPAGLATVNIPPVAVLTATPSGTVAPYQTVTLSGSDSSDQDGTLTTWTFSQTAGTTGTLSGTGSTRTVVMPATTDGDTLTFQLTVTDNSAAVSPAVTVTLTVLPHNHWVRNTAGNGWNPVNRQVRRNSAWVVPL